MSLALLGFKVGHQVVSLALPHCLGMPFWHYQLLLSLYLHQLESHKLSFNKVTHSLSLFETSGPIDRTPGTPGSDKKLLTAFSHFHPHPLLLKIRQNRRQNNRYPPQRLAIDKVQEKGLPNFEREAMPGAWWGVLEVYNRKIPIIVAWVALNELLQFRTTVVRGYDD